MALTLWKTKAIPNGWSKKKQFTKLTVEGITLQDATNALTQKATQTDAQINWVLSFKVSYIPSSQLHRASGTPYILVPTK